MIKASESGNYKHITKISILDAKKVFYPLASVLRKRDIQFDDDQALIIFPIPEDVEYPATFKTGDSGPLREYKVSVSINNQSRETEEQLEAFEGRRVIVVLHYSEGKMIFGCNEMPLEYSLNDENLSDPAMNAGYRIACRGTSYFLKVST